MTSGKKLLQVLEILCSEGIMGVTEISKSLSLGKSAIHRFLSTLVESGYVRKTAHNRKYCPTLKTFTIGAMIRDRINLVDQARMHMKDLANETGESVFLSVYSSGKVAYLDKVDSRELLKIDLPLGRRAPAHCTAPGKVFLSNLQPQDLEDYLKHNKLVAHTNNTINSSKALKSELDKVRKQGYAIDNEETLEGVRCVAAPIFDELGNVISAISLVGPSVRLSEERLAAISRAVVRITTEISENLL